MRLLVTALASALAGCGGAASVRIEAGGAAPKPTPVLACRDGASIDRPLVTAGEVTFGPLSILRWTPGDLRDAFYGLGWKLPVSLRAGTTATLLVPHRLQGRVGLVFTHAAQARVHRDGVVGADSRVTFRACGGRGAPARTGWPGGIVVDRPRCARLRVRIAGAAEPIERPVPLGKRCP